MGFLVDEAGAGAVDDDAHDQARARPEEHHEPGQDLRAVDALEAAERPRRGELRRARGAASWPARARVQCFVTSPVPSTLSRCTPKPHSRATCLSTSCAPSCSGRSLCCVWRSVSERSPRRLTFQTWMLGSREPRSYWRDSASRTRAVAGVVVDRRDLELALASRRRRSRTGGSRASASGDRYWPMKLSSLKLRIAWSSVGSQSACRRCRGTTRGPRRSGSRRCA